MLTFLENNESLLDRPTRRTWSGTRFLPNIFPPVVIVTGLPCAGKTTLGKHLSEQFGYYHIEASDFMKRAFFERHGVTSRLSIEAFAEKVLQREPDIVVAPVLKEMQRSRAELVVITGFRSSEEIEIFKRKYPGPCQILCYFVEASQKIRFERSRARARSDAPPTFSSFRQRDATQFRMGLKNIKMSLRKSIVKNESTIEEYVESCASQLNASARAVTLPKLADLHARPPSLEETILLGLAVLERRGLKSLSTTEIARQLNKLFPDSDYETNKNNVSRYFNFRPSAFYQPEEVDGVMKYSLSATGRSRALCIAAERQAKKLNRTSPLSPMTKRAKDESL